jgi:hypothetical protein
MSVSMAARSMASVLPELMNEAIERRIIRRLRSFVGCDRAHQVGSIGRATEDGPEGLLIFPNRREATAGCKRPIKMSPLCQLEMTLPGGFPGGVRGDGSADERWGADAA